MKGIFIESSIFEKYRQKYLSDYQYLVLQLELLTNPVLGDVIRGSGGLRKVRVSTQGKGKRGGARVIYYYFDKHRRFYLLTIYAKNEVTDLTKKETNQLKQFMESWKNEQS